MSWSAPIYPSSGGATCGLLRAAAAGDHGIDGREGFEGRRSSWWDLHPMIYRWFIHVDGWDLLVIYPGNWYCGEFPGNQWKYCLVVWNMNGLWLSINSEQWSQLTNSFFRGLETTNQYRWFIRVDAWLRNPAPVDRWFMNGKHPMILLDLAGPFRSSKDRDVILMRRYRL